MRATAIEDRAKLVAYTDARMKRECPVDTKAARNSITVTPAARSDSLRVYVRGSVPYFQRLADGWSRQAKKGWVDNILKDAVRLPGGRPG